MRLVARGSLKREAHGPREGEDTEGGRIERGPADESELDGREATSSQGR